MRSDAYHHPDHHCWKCYGCVVMIITHADRCRQCCGYAVVNHRLYIPILDISKGTLGTVKDTGDRLSFTRIVAGDAVTVQKSR